MAKKNENAETTAKVETTEEPKALALVVKELKPKQKFLNYETSEEQDVEILSQKFEVPAKPAGMDEAVFEAKVLELAAALVSPVRSQIDAFLNFATSKSYQDGKAAAIASGPFVTSDVMDRICEFMVQLPPFADLSKSERRTRWIAGYKAGKSGPKQMLEKALALTQFDSDF